MEASSVIADASAFVIDTGLRDYKKRRSAFLDGLIASTPNVSLRAKEFRRWIAENSPDTNARTADFAAEVATPLTADNEMM